MRTDSVTDSKSSIDFVQHVIGEPPSFDTRKADLIDQHTKLNHQLSDFIDSLNLTDKELDTLQMKFDAEQEAWSAIFEYEKQLLKQFYCGELLKLRDLVFHLRDEQLRYDPNSSGTPPALTPKRRRTRCSPLCHHGHDAVEARWCNTNIAVAAKSVNEQNSQEELDQTSQPK